MVWIAALEQLLKQLSMRFDLAKIDAIICDATSSTVMLTDDQGTLLSNALMYNDAQAISAASRIKEMSVEQQTAANGASSSLAKALYLSQLIDSAKPKLVVHQIDWLNNYFCDFLKDGICYSDQNNLLKFGYDPVSGQYPDWLQNITREYAPNIILPVVGVPGEALAPITGNMQTTWGFSQNCRVLYGTTDSIAGFFASGAQKKNDAVSSLGSTLAIKQLINVPIFNTESGLYSHKVKDLWLLGGASNGGGKVLLDYYALPQIIWMDHFLQALWRLQNLEGKRDWLIHYPVLHNCHNLGDYYALSSIGERFPIQDSQMVAILEARPSQSLQSINLENFPITLFSEVLSSRELSETLKQCFADNLEIILQNAQYFASIVQGLVQIEKKAFELLSKQTGDGKTANLYTVGGGSKNRYWQLLRQVHLENCLQSAFSLDAAYGVTRLANFS
ncbi:D-ribulokinase [uncultured Thiomicrorhabdus sp.]